MPGATSRKHAVAGDRSSTLGRTFANSYATCASGECIPREPPKTKPGLVGYEAPEPNTPGACTEPCSNDGGCPAEMRCTDVIVLPMFPGVTTVKDEPDKPPGRCIPLNWN